MLHNLAIWRVAQQKQDGIEMTCQCYYVQSMRMRISVCTEACRVHAKFRGS